MPVGFKNATNGDLKVAYDAIQTSHNPHVFIGINQEGNTCTIQSMGNPDCHIVLRGGTTGPNYSTDDINKTISGLEKRHLNTALLVDCSHGNSNKDYKRQPEVVKSVTEQRNNGYKEIIGIMIESNINEGNQRFPQPKDDLKYGVSITDSCISWETTVKTLETLYQSLS